MCVFLEKTPHLSPTNVPTIAINNDYEFDIQEPTMTIDHEVTTVEQNHSIEDEECSRDVYANMNFAAHNGNNERVRYQDLIQVFTELARCVQNNQTQCAAVLADTKDWINCYRSGFDFEVKFVNVNNIREDMLRESNEANQATCNGNAQGVMLAPLPASTNAVPVASKQRRKRSTLEIQRNLTSKYSSISLASSRMSQTSIGSNINNGDDAHLPDPNLKGRNCILCRGNGHGQFECPKMTDYGGTPLPKNNVLVRQQLQSDLYQMDIFAISKRSHNDTRSIMLSFPRSKVPGLIIHKRLLIDNTLLSPSVPNNLCLECTTW